ncbi:MAG TPA: Mrp/NBP35 family ATP-binding protein [Patescibacteria group bacterium]|nr:Mrp/NBP35 family ATP-binding protein [Patescibacteria group bacterium]
MTEGAKFQTQQQKLDEQAALIKRQMGKIKHKIAVISGKGGVGKSLVTVNLAASLVRNGREGKVAILDADLTGPCVPKMMGLKGETLQVGPPGIFPAMGKDGVKVVSMAFLLPSVDSPVIWRGPLKMGVIKQFLGEVAWGPLDFLLVDLPPGTGDESLSILQLLPEMDGVIIVTIPSEVSEEVVRKAVTFARKMEVPILGIIENMSGVICPKCGERIDVFGVGGGERVATDMGVTLLGKIPLDPLVSEAMDAGTPFVVAQPDTPAAVEFKKIVGKIERVTEQ